MKVDNDLMMKLEKLASLKLSNSKKKEVESQLSEILEFVENLNEIDISGIDATFTTLTGGTRLEDDIIKNQNEISQSILKNAPKSDENFFIVPKIIE